MAQVSCLLGLVGIALCTYLLYFRSFIKDHYPIFYTYITITLVFELQVLWALLGGADSTHTVSSSLLINHGFQLYLIAYLYRKLLKEEYSSINLLFYVTFFGTGLLVVGGALVSLSVKSISEVGVQATRAFLLADVVFVTLLLVIVQRSVFHVVLNVKGMIYGLAFMVWLELPLEFLSEQNPLHPLRDLPWIGALLIYCQDLSLPSGKLYDVSREEQARLLTVNDRLKMVDQKLFYHFILKARIYNAFTDQHYFRFLSPVASSKNEPKSSYLEKLYKSYKFRWCGLYYRLVDPLLLGNRPLVRNTGGDLVALAPQGTAALAPFVASEKKASDCAQEVVAGGHPSDVSSGKVMVASAGNDRT